MCLDCDRMDDIIALAKRVADNHGDDVQELAAKAIDLAERRKDDNAEAGERDE